MALNGYQGQLRAKDQQDESFKANQELYNLIVNNSNGQVAYISRIGIQYRQQSKIHFLLNNKEFELNDKGFYEASDVAITSLKFLEDTDDTAIIDFIVELE